MEDLVPLAVGLGFSAVTVGASSVYEYGRCRKMLRKERELTYLELHDLHHPAEYLLMFVGAPGVELARSRYSRASSSDH